MRIRDHRQVAKKTHQFLQYFQKLFLPKKIKTKHIKQFTHISPKPYHRKRIINKIGSSVLFHSTDEKVFLSYCPVKVAVVTVEVPDDIVEFPRLCDPEDRLSEVIPSLFCLFFSGLFTLRSMKSEISPGFVIFLSSMLISPVSIFTTVDMDGRSFGLSCVQSRPIFRYLQASSASKSPFNDISTSRTSSPRS